MTEFNEPWELDGTFGIVDSLGEVAVEYCDVDFRYRARIAACVNACAGILTEQLIYLRPGILSGIAAEHQPLAWRKEPPDKPGWWWRRSNYGGRISIRQVVLGAGGELLVDAGAFYKLDHYNDSEWAGPIEPPEAINI